jgi:hypothetical protein
LRLPGNEDLEAAGRIDSRARRAAPPLHASMVTDPVRSTDVSPRSGAPVLDFGRRFERRVLVTPGVRSRGAGGRGDAWRGPTIELEALGSLSEAAEDDPWGV